MRCVREVYVSMTKLRDVVVYRQHQPTPARRQMQGRHAPRSDKKATCSHEALSAYLMGYGDIMFTPRHQPLLSGAACLVLYGRLIATPYLLPDDNI